MASADDALSETGSFKSAQSDHAPEPTASAADDQRLSPEEESTLLKESNLHKATGNSFFGKSAYSDAISTYDKALASCPTYLDYEIAVLQANIAACHVKLEEWKTAVDSATLAIERLDKLDYEVGLKSAKTHEPRSQSVEEVVQEHDRIQEVDDEQAAHIERLERSGRGLAEVRKLRVKALMRRARGREGVGGWASLASAEEDYKALLSPQLVAVLSPLDRKTIDHSVRELGPRLEKAKQDEMGEMMGKLKELGNSILRPFGLSTNNFQFTQGEGGGYNMQFNQNPGQS